MKTCYPRRAAAHAPLESYLREINETPLLTAEEEKELAYRIGEGDAEARDHLVRANLRLVVNLARDYTGRGLELSDLIAEGNLGLLRAAEGFDPHMNTRFSTYASYWIKQSIKRTLINTAKMIRVPSYMVELLTKWRRAVTQLRREFGRLPTEEEVAAHLHLSKKRLQIVRQAIRIYQACPLTGQEDTDSTLMEAPDQASASPNSSLTDEDNLQQVLALLDQLPARDAAVLRMRFGLDGEEPLTLKEIGERLDLTRERVRQIEKQALAALSDSVTATGAQSPSGGELTRPPRGA